MKKYQSRIPILTEKDANVIGQFIEKKFNGNGVTPSELLEAARSKSSPIHKYFLWDDTEAAEKYRLSQARHLIISIYVESDDKPVTREYLRVNIGTGMTYLDRDRVSEDESLVDQVIADAHQQLLRWKDRYSGYCDFFGKVFQEIEKLEPKGSNNEKETRREREEDKHSWGKSESRKDHNPRRQSVAGAQV